MSENLNQQFVMREMYDVALKATFPIEIKGRKFEEGETVAVFDKIQLGVLDEEKRFAAATGGYDNRDLVWWEETKNVQVRLTQGVYSKVHFALMTNAALEEFEHDIVHINRREVVETDENGLALSKYPMLKPIFVYDEKTGEKLDSYTVENDNEVRGLAPYTSLILDYWFAYDKGYSITHIGRALTNGTFVLVGKTRVKDDETGQVKTGIITIPKLRLMSDLSMRLGKDAVPLLGQLDAVALPTGVKGNKKVMSIIFLNDDIDSDID